MNWRLIVVKVLYGAGQGGIAAFVVGLNGAPQWGVMAVFFIVGFSAMEHMK